jgi:hypothetical protein
MEHLLDMGEEVAGLTDIQREAIAIGRSRAFWREPKDLLLTLGACCLASLTQGKSISFLKLTASWRSVQFWPRRHVASAIRIEPPITHHAQHTTDRAVGWDQVATGNLGWPTEFGLDFNINHPLTTDTWIFGAVNAITWFSAAIIG